MKGVPNRNSPGSPFFKGEETVEGAIFLTVAAVASICVCFDRCRRFFSLFLFQHILPPLKDGGRPIVVDRRGLKGRKEKVPHC